MTQSILTQKIVAKVRMEPDNPLVIVRKVDFKEDGRVDKKYGLNRNGDWIEVPEATDFPEECFLPVALYPPCSSISSFTKVKRDS